MFITMAFVQASVRGEDSPSLMPIVGVLLLIAGATQLAGGLFLYSRRGARGPERLRNLFIALAVPVTLLLTAAALLIVQVNRTR
jgi:hypothetical protein